MKPLLVVLVALASPLAGQSTIDPALPYAYLANAGWLNFRPSSAHGVVVQEHFLGGYAFAANSGWMHLGDGTPTNGHTYSNTTSADFGVNRDTAGNLGGYAWCANTGWVNFGWATSSDANRPRLNLANGSFSGDAYSANAGWLNLGSGFLKTSTISYPDTDGDGIADSWERAHFSTLAAATANSDFDRDGQSDRAEYQADTNPLVPSSNFRVVSQTLNAPLTGNTLVFTTSPGRLYRIETHTQLDGAPWIDSGLGTFAPDPGATTSRFFPFATGPRMFFRAVAVPPLSP